MIRNSFHNVLHTSFWMLKEATQMTHNGKNKRCKVASTTAFASPSILPPAFTLFIEIRLNQRIPAGMEWPLSSDSMELPLKHCRTVQIVLRSGKLSAFSTHLRHNRFTMLLALSGPWRKTTIWHQISKIC